MTTPIATLWKNVVPVPRDQPDDTVLEGAARWLRRVVYPEQLASAYCLEVAQAIGLPRKMTGEHLLRMCLSVWSEALGLSPAMPLLELLEAKAAEAPYRDHFGLWDGLWLPLAFEEGQLVPAALGQRSGRTPRLRRELERLLGVPHGAPDEELQAAVEEALRRLEFEERARAAGLPAGPTGDDLEEREAELRLPDLRAVNGRFPEDALDRYLRARDRGKALLGYTQPVKSTAFLPMKCARCHRTIHDYAVPCPKDGGVCDDVAPDYYERRVGAEPHTVPV